MQQLELFAAVAVTPQAQTPSLTLRRYCKQCRRKTPAPSCQECRVTVKTFKDECACLRSNVLRHSHADEVTLCIPGYEYTDSVAGVEERIYWLLAAGVCGELVEEWTWHEDTAL